MGLARSRRIAAGALAVLLSTAASPASAASTTITTSHLAAYARVLSQFNPNLSMWESRALADRVRVESLFYRLDPRLLVALVATESSWHPYAVSPVGARGLGQLMPGTAAGLGVDPFSPHANLNGTARYLRGLLDRYAAYPQAQRYRLALAGYNAGPGSVERFGGIPPYSETQAYVRNVMALYDRLSLSLSTHIDETNKVVPDGVAVASVQQAAQHRKPASTHTIARTHPQRSTTIVADLSSDAPDPQPTPAPRHRGTFYYFFHHDRPSAQQIAEGPEAIAVVRDLGLRVASTVYDGHPIRVDVLTPGASPVTLVARVGQTFIGAVTLPRHTNHALLRGIPAADVTRVVDIYAYAQGYYQAHAAVTVLSKS
jgi:Transglycosylase SLT domain